MKSDNYICINNKTFEIMKLENCYIFNKKLGEIILILNKKGYEVEMGHEAVLFRPFLISDIIHNLIEEKLLNVNEANIEKIKNIISQDDYESTIICFKKDYKFKCLPTGFTMLNNNLSYNLRILKDSSNIEFKSLNALNKENIESLKSLKEWAENL